MGEPWFGLWIEIAFSERGAHLAQEPYSKARALGLSQDAVPLKKLVGFQQAPCERSRARYGSFAILLGAREHPLRIDG